MHEALYLSRRHFLASSALGLAGMLSRAKELKGEASKGWQIGCYTRPFDDHDYRTALDSIAEAGYTHCGIMTAKGKSWVIVTPETSPEAAQQVGQAIKERKLKVLSLYGGDFPAAEGVERGAQGLRRLIENCALVGSPSLMLGGVSDEKLYATYFQIIAECCPYAETKGVGLCMKPHGGLNATGQQCRQAVEKVGHRNFGIWYDPGNIFYYSDGKLDPIDDCGSVDGLVVGMSIKDYLPPKEVMVTPGTGRVNFAKVLTRLKEGGFRGGPLVVECLKKGSLKEVISEAKAARRFLEELVKQ